MYIQKIASTVIHKADSGNGQLKILAQNANSQAMMDSD